MALLEKNQRFVLVGAPLEAAGALLAGLHFLGALPAVAWLAAGAVIYASGLVVCLVGVHRAERPKPAAAAPAQTGFATST